MSGFWNEIKQSFSGSKEELDETSKAILDIENKKKTITQASNNEQAAIREHISGEYRKIGETSYTLYEEGCFEIEKIANMLIKVRELYQSLSEKQAKLDEILSRYDDELKILQPAPPMGQAICHSCGSAYLPGEMLFCRVCGTQLPMANTYTAGTKYTAGTEYTAMQPTICANCGAENVADAVFCSRCGNAVDIKFDMRKK